jgi:hypothetical protein
MILVDVENYQSIEKASVKIDRFTALVGRSNIGKSALVRAVRSALTGAVGTDFVRHGKDCERRLKGNKKCRCFSKVRIEIPSFLTLVWEKGDAVNKYTVTKDGQTTVYDSVERGTPDFLLPSFASVKVGDSKDLIQVSEQFDPIFLLNQSGPAVADVLSDVAHLDRINIAMSLVNKDRKDAAATRKVRESDVIVLKKDLEAYDGLDAVVARAQKVTDQYAKVGEKKARANMFERFVLQAQVLTTALKALMAATKPEAPELDPLTTKSTLCSQLQKFYEEVAERLPIVKALSGVDEVEVPEVQPIQGGYKHLFQIAEWLVKLEAFDSLDETLRKFDDLVDPELAPLLAAASRYELFQGFADRLIVIRDETAALQAELEETEKEEKAVLDGFGELGVCPTCSQKVEASHHFAHEAAS